MTFSSWFLRPLWWSCLAGGLGATCLALQAAETPAAPATNAVAQSQDFRALMEARRVAAEQDRNRMLDLLKIPKPGPSPPPAEDPRRPTHLAQRPGSNNWYDKSGNTHVRSGWGNWSNYDESKAGGYTLPDPLRLKDGRAVNSAETWWQQRRPEILQDFETEIYGRIPRNTPQVTFEVTENVPDALAGSARMKTIVGLVGNTSRPTAGRRVELTLYTPVAASGPVPVIVQASGFFGPFRPGTNGLGGSNRTPNGPPSPLEQVLAKGWGFALFNTSAIQMDSGAGLNEGIIGLLNNGQPRKPDDWGVLAAWSWGLSRVLDYLATDPEVDAKRLGVQGHSRWGKAALLAGALDQRWAVVFSSCSGAMGASLEKRNWGETIDNVCGSGEYHWMAGNFLKYGGNWQAMPVDAHELIALVAPRPVFITGGTQDQWSDPHGEFLACVGADPVYRLLGKRGLGTAEMPAPDVALTSGELAFRNHDGGHTDAPDWPVFLDFASRYLKAPAGK